MSDVFYRRPWVKFMSGADDKPEVGFNERLQYFIQRIEVREPRDEFERANIFRTRYDGYKRAGMLIPGASEYFTDSYDLSPNAKIFGLYIDGDLTASIRIHVASRDTPILPTLSVYSDFLQPLLDEGKIIVDPTRHVVDFNAARKYPKLPYATLRLAWTACEHYGADHILSTIPAVNTAHLAFYRRIFGRMIISEPRSYPGLADPVVLMAADCRALRDGLHARYPFLISTEAERQALFGSGESSGRDPRVLVAARRCR